ncbi:MAG: ribose 5-phosphate isomerase [Bacteroidota bacterium]|jgi:ribose 5-phosphate isomerase B
MTQKPSFALAADHAGYQLKEYLKDWLIAQGHEVEDFGTYSDERCDYPDFAHPMADSVENGEHVFGLSVCGSGNGINITVNKHPGIRAAYCWNEEIATLAREHNDANVCSLPARFLSEELAVAILKAFIAADFEGGRHQERVDKIPL